MLAPRHGERVEHVLHADEIMADAPELGIEKADIEGRVVDDEPRIADEGGEGSAISLKSGLSARNSFESPCTASAPAETGHWGLI